MNLRNSGSKLILAVLVAIVVIGGIATWRETRTAAYVDIPALPTATAHAAAATSPAAATRPATPAAATSEAEDSGSDGSGDG
jgi:hypothetical protein